MKGLALPLVALALFGTAQAQGVWRCGGNAYGDTPCPGGRNVEVGDMRSADELQAAREVALREARALERLLAERRAREAEALATTVYYGPRREALRTAPRAATAPALSPRSVSADPPKPPRQAKRSGPAADGTSPATARASRHAKG